MTTTLEVRRSKDQVILWTPDAHAALNKAETKQLIDALKVWQNKSEPVEVSRCVGEIDIRNMSDYVQVNITVHRPSQVEVHNCILNHDQLPKVVAGLEGAYAEVFRK